MFWKAAHTGKMNRSFYAEYLPDPSKKPLFKIPEKFELTEDKTENEKQDIIQGERNDDE